jgi:hypothetical protein
VLFHINAQVIAQASFVLYSEFGLQIRHSLVDVGGVGIQEHAVVDVNEEDRRSSIKDAFIHSQLYKTQLLHSFYQVQVPRSAGVLAAVDVLHDVEAVGFAVPFELEPLWYVNVYVFRRYICLWVSHDEIDLSR